MRKPNAKLTLLLLQQYDANNKGMQFIDEKTGRRDAANDETTYAWRAAA